MGSHCWAPTLGPGPMWPGPWTQAYRPGPWAGSTVGCAFAPTTEVLIVLRCLSGAFLGALNPVTSTLIADIAPAESRGAYFGVTFCVGIIGSVLGSGDGLPSIGASSTKASMTGSSMAISLSCI